MKERNWSARLQRFLRGSGGTPTLTYSLLGVTAEGQTNKTNTRTCAACLVLSRYQRESRSFVPNCWMSRHVSSGGVLRCARRHRRVKVTLVQRLERRAGQCLHYPATRRLWKLVGCEAGLRLASWEAAVAGNGEVNKLLNSSRHFFFFLNQSKYLPGGRPWSCFDALFKTVFAQITQCCLTDLKDISAGARSWSVCAVNVCRTWFAALTVRVLFHQPVKPSALWNHAVPLVFNKVATKLSQ